MDQVESLVRHNVENLRWAALQNLNQAFRQFAASLEEQLRDTTTATHGAVAAAWKKRTDHAAAVADEAARLRSATARLEEVKEDLRGLFL
jgi:ABC-type transporter Mla subunit MlaD